MSSRSLSMVAALGQCLHSPSSLDRLTTRLRREVASIDEADFLRCVGTQKVVPQVHARLKGFSTEISGVKRLLNAVENRFPYVNELADAKTARMEEWRGVIAMARRLAIPMVCAKGAFFHASQAYPEGSVRHFAGDLDVFVPNWNHAWRLWEGLAQLGFTQDPELQAWVRGAWEANAGQAVPSVGQVLLSKETKYGKVMVDCHIGAMTVGLSGALELDLFSRAQSAEWLGEQVLLPSPEDNLLLFTAHAYNHGYFTLKDINDVYALVRAFGAHMDWQYIEKSGRENGLLDGLRFLLGRISLDYPELTCVPSHLKGYQGPSIALWSYRHGLAHPFWGRFPLHCRYTWQYERQRMGVGAGLKLTFRQVLHNARMYAAGYSRSTTILRLVNWASNIPEHLLVPAPSRDYQAFLFPIDLGDLRLPSIRLPKGRDWKVSEWEPGLFAVQKDDAELLVGSMGLFVASATTELTETQTEKVMALAGEVLEELLAEVEVS